MSQKFVDHCKIIEFLTSTVAFSSTRSFHGVIKKLLPALWCLDIRYPLSMYICFFFSILFNILLSIFPKILSFLNLLFVARSVYLATLILKELGRNHLVLFSTILYSIIMFGSKKVPVDCFLVSLFLRWFISSQR